MITKMGKKLTNRDADSNKTLGNTADTGKMLAGAGITKRLADKGHLSGRELLYHGTDPAAANSIKQTGLQPTSEATAKSTKNLKVNPEVYQKSLGKSYLTPHKAWANRYAIQSNLIAGGMTPEGIHDPNAVRDMVVKKGGKGVIRREAKEGLVKAKVPTWKMNRVPNPEVDGIPFHRWVSQNIGDMNYYAMGPVQRAQVISMYNNYHDDVVLDGAVDPKYIKGSKYVRPKGREVMEFIKANPGRFAKGALGAAAGLGLAAHGAYGLLNRNRAGDEPAPNTK